MNRKFIIATVVACVGSLDLKAQTDNEGPKGQAIVQVFGNFRTGFGAQNDERGFDLDRSYLGYQYNLGKGLSVKGVMDVGKSSDVSDYHRVAYIKNAVKERMAELAVQALNDAFAYMEKKEKFNYSYF